MPTPIKKITQSAKFKLSLKILTCLCLLLFYYFEFFSLELQLLEKQILTGSAPKLFLCLFALKTLFFGILLSILCYVIFHITAMFQTFRQTKQKRGLLYALSLASFFSLSLSPLNNERTEVTSFDRVFGHGLIRNFDCSSVIQNFTVFFSFFAITFLLFWLFINNWKAKEQTAEQTVAMRFLDNIVLVFFVMLFFRLLTFFQSPTSPYSIYLVALILTATAAYLVLRLDRFWEFKQHLKLLICGLSLGYPLNVLLGLSGNSTTLIFAQTFSLLFVISIVAVLSKLVDPSLYLSGLTSGSIVFSFFPFLTSVYVESLHILNQHNIFISRPVLGYFFLVLFLFLVFASLFVILYKKKKDVPQWKSFAYPAFLFGVACLSAQIIGETTYIADIFEYANFSVLISDFLNFGSLPIVEHYGGHMMTAVFEGLLWAWFNNDLIGAAFSPYLGYASTLLILLFFYMVKQVWDEDAALWATLLLPFYGNWQYFGLGSLTIFATIAFIKKNSYPRAFLFWISIIFCALIRLDLGVAFGVGCVITLIIYLLTKKEKESFKKIAFSFGTVGIICVIIWCLLCITNGINPFIRLYEFIQISMSNSNWAYGNLGNTSIPAFAWSYLFLPLTIIASLVYATLEKNIRASVGDTKWCILLIFGISYLANFSRGLVRHSVAEMNWIVIIWSAYIYLSLFLAFRKNKSHLFLPIFAGFILINSLLFSSVNFSEISVVDQAASKTEQISSSLHSSYWSDIAEEKRVLQRVQFESNQAAEFDNYKTVMDLLLTEEETYLDFSNRTFIYSVIGRKVPVYVAQSPGHLSGEFTAEQFVEQVRSNLSAVPLVVMPIDGSYFNTALDGIPNSYRYYKVSEFVYTNYVPLCQSDYFALWCLPDRYDEMSTKILTLNDLQIPVSLISAGYDGPFVHINESNALSTFYKDLLHEYCLYNLPRFWAELDTQHASNNKPVSSAQAVAGNLYIFDEGSIIKNQTGNYLLLSGYCNNATNIQIKLGVSENGVFAEKYKYEIITTEGTHQYLLRVSSDYYWYFEDINAVLIEDGGALQNISITILEGD